MIKKIEEQYKIGNVVKKRFYYVVNEKKVWGFSEALKAEFENHGNFYLKMFNISEEIAQIFDLGPTSSCFATIGIGFEGWVNFLKILPFLKQGENIVKETKEELLSKNEIIDLIEKIN